MATNLPPPPLLRAQVPSDAPATVAQSNSQDSSTPNSRHLGSQPPLNSTDPSLDNVSEIGEAEHEPALTAPVRMEFSYPDPNSPRVKEASVKKLNAKYTKQIKERFPDVELLRFEKLGNKRKYKESREVLFTLLEIIDSSSEDDNASLFRAVDQLMTILKNCRIADAFPQGWNLVDEVQHSPLFDDQEEERQFRKAAKRMEEKKKPVRSFRGRPGNPRFVPYNQRPGTSGTNTSANPWPKLPITCWNCGKGGHTRSQCQSNSSYRPFK